MFTNGDKKNNRIIFMKPIISSAIFMAWLMSPIICRGNTAVNNEQEEFQLVQGAILQFQKDTNEFPTSWDDLWNNPASRPSVESLDQGKIFGRRTDMMESFRFIASGTTILLPGDRSRVIGMMTRPMRPPPDIQRRLLIVRLEDGTRGFKRIEEDVLGRMFTKAGFNLADYTGPDGNWAPESHLRPLSEIPPAPERALSDPSMDHDTIPALPLSKKLTTGRKKEWWTAGGIALLLLITICVWRFIAKRNIGKRK